MSKIIKYSIVAAILALLVGLGIYFYFNPTKALNMVVPNLTGVVSVEIEVKGDTAYLDLNVLVENKAPYSMNVRAITYDVQMDGTTLVTEEHKMNLHQKSGQIDTVSLLINLPHRTIAKVMKDIQGQDSTSVGAEFSITYETLFGELTIPTSFTVSVPTPVPPKVELNKIKMGFFNFKEKRFQLFINISVLNENNIKISVEDLTYQAEFGDNLTGHGEFDERLTLKAMDNTNLELPVIIDIDRPMEVIWNIITNKDRMDYELHFKGTLVQETKTGKDFPFDITVKGEAELVK